MTKSFKKTAIIAIIAIAAIILLPVILVIQALSMALWHLGLAQSSNRVIKHQNGAKTIEVEGRASRLVGYGLKLGGMGLLDLSISPALALPTKGLVVVRTEMCARYAHLTQCFIGSHELGHLLDPAAKKMFAGADIRNEFTADAYAVKALLLTPIQVKEIFDNLYEVTSADVSAKTRQQLKETLMTRRDRAIQVSEQYMPATATLTATRR